MNHTLPSSARLRLRLALVDVSLALATMALLTLYLLALLDLSAIEWNTLAGVVGVFAIAAAAVLAPLRRRAQRPVMRFLDGEREGSVSAEELRQAFAAAVALPSTTQKLIGAAFGAAAVVVPRETSPIQANRYRSGHR